MAAQDNSPQCEVEVEVEVEDGDGEAEAATAAVSVLGFLLQIQASALLSIPPLGQ
jgi:hypothetical protein